jgi:O-acetyl-ADP-ribose deacetylase (regulator of RNase III)
MSMIECIEGNILEARVEALVNTVNTVGVMGKGIALQFRQAFPANYYAYRAAVDRGEVALGHVFVFETGTIEYPHFVINFPTKGHWRGRSKLTDIEAGLADLRRIILRREIASIAIPALGCGHGGLRWADVRPRIEESLGDIPDVKVVLFPPSGAPPADQMKVRTPRPRMTPGRAALIGLLGRYLEPGYAASMLEVQKLLYFMQEAGEPLKLRYAQAKLGPYAEQVHHVLQSVEGHYLRGYGDRSASSSARLVAGAFDQASAFLETRPETRARFDRVLELIEGYESPYGLELLATTHWVTQENPQAARDASHVVIRVQAWSQRKKDLFTSDHITRAWRRLSEQRWLPA